MRGRGSGTRPSGNLPAEANSFVGRRAEVADVRRLLSRARLVTLAGVGGVGKSRLAQFEAGFARGGELTLEIAAAYALSERSLDG